MTLRKLKKRDDGSFSCPGCGNPLRFKDGEAVAIVGGQLDMENYKPRYICDACKVYYRAVLTTDYYDVFPLEETKAEKQEPQPAVKEPEKPPGKGPIALPKEPTGNETCPVCGKHFRFVEGGAVRVVNGEVDMENIKPKYECDTCGVFYREVLTSGFYLPYPQEEEDKLKANEEPAPSKVLSTGDLAPMILKRNENNQCQCPRCGAMMDYVEGQAVHLVDGKPDMENVWDHFHCGSCHSVFRRIVNTDYFQFTEK